MIEPLYLVCMTIARRHYPDRRIESHELSAAYWWLDGK